MFVGRQDELQALDALYQKPGFQMVVLYGRRRVGKTALLSRFCRGKKALYFTAEQKTDTDNLRAFSQTIWSFFENAAERPRFETWRSAFDFIVDHCKADERLVIVFDEFPYAALANPSLPSVLQVAIDHAFKRTNVFLALCGSNEGFMESEVLGYKSPLYGRRTAQIKLKPLDYQDAAGFLPGLPPTEQVSYFSAFGGTPYYLEQIDPSSSFADNIARLMFDIAGVLYAEPQMLLRQELRDPSTYTSVLDAIGSGATVPKAIAERAGVGQDAVSSYLSALVRLGLVRRDVPFGDNPSRSRKGLYRLADPFFAYWYRFVSPRVGAIEAGLGQGAATQASAGRMFSTYEGEQFELICRQWFIRQARQGNTPFLPLEIGRWWGTDPALRERVDIDLVAGSKTEQSIYVGECKYRNSFDESKALETLQHRSGLIPGYRHVRLALFTKEKSSRGTLDKAAKRKDLDIVTLEDIYEDVL